MRTVCVVALLALVACVNGDVDMSSTTINMYGWVDSIQVGDTIPRTQCEWTRDDATAVLSSMPKHVFRGGHASDFWHSGHSTALSRAAPPGSQWRLAYEATLRRLKAQHIRDLQILGVCTAEQ